MRERRENPSPEGRREEGTNGLYEVRRCGLTGLPRSRPGRRTEPLAAHRSRSRDVLVVGLNLAIDRTHFLAELKPGHVQRPREALGMAGGKALNVVRAATRVGGRPRLLGFAGGPIGEALTRLIAAESFAARLVECEGDTRCAIIVLEDSGRVTVLNEPGPIITLSEWQTFLDVYDEEAPTAGVVVASGSLPPGTPPDAYAELVRRGHARGARVIVDSSHDALAATLRAEPDVVAPNLAEACVVLGEASDEAVDESAEDAPERALAAGAGLVERGARVALVSVGRHGLAIVSKSERAFLTAPLVQVANPIGAGDSLVGGLAVALDSGASMLEAARLGIAAAAASVVSRTPADVDGVLARHLLRHIERLI